MNPSTYYLDDNKTTHKVNDVAQLAVMQNFDRLYAELTKKITWREKIKSHFNPSPIKGIYLWGEVGRGKTFLVNCFLQAIPAIPHTRLHFHEFMRRVHHELKLIQGKANPLNFIAKKFRQEFKVLCLDEFIVSDITDAMILGELLKALFDQGISLVTTSNTPPDELYKNGLQRSRFLPAIELLKTHTEVLHLGSAEDYRLRHLKEAGVYYTPLNEASEKKMQAAFKAITHSQNSTQENLAVLGRSIPVIQRSDQAAWFDFNHLCGIQRSQNDYLALTEQFSFILISHIPIIHAKQRDLITNFIKLIDILYDTKTKLIVSAEANPRELYPNGPEEAIYQRTASRLIEMQSQDYFYQK